MFWRLFFPTFLATSFALAQTATRSMETEAPAPGSQLRIRKGDQPITVEAGVGARELDPAKNELGLELTNMEKLDELSPLRRARPWWLELKPSSQWRQQLHADLSLNQEIRLRTVGQKKGIETRLEVGLSQDHRRIPMVRSTGNPFDAKDDARIEIDGKRDSAFAALGIRTENHLYLIDMDGKTENIFAGPVLTGEKTAREQSVGAALKTSWGEFTPFMQTREIDFSSRLSPIYSNSTANWRGGVRYKTQGSDWRFEPQLTAEGFDRTYSDTSTSKFRRSDLQLKGFSEFKLRSLDGRAHLFLQQLQTSHETLRNDQTWDAGVEVSQGLVSGWLGRVRSYSLAPTPSQLFGDGGLLAGSPDLPPARGVRAAVGWWGRPSDWKWEISVFTEQESNSPVPVAVSPIRARTIAIGGVWNRGLEMNAEMQWAGLTGLAKYSYQDAVNNSKIDWQRGQRVPGRPQHVASFDVSSEAGRWRRGLKYIYRSEEALDLSGLWQKPPHHDLGGYVGYAEKTWQVRLAAAHALASLHKLPSADFSGSAGTSLLEPNLEQTEVRLQCEILL